MHNAPKRARRSVSSKATLSWNSSGIGSGGQTGVLAIAAQQRILHTIRTDTQNRKGYNVQTDANTHNTD
eukprot:4798350-Amphidinium_carterae.2